MDMCCWAEPNDGSIVNASWLLANTTIDKEGCT